MQLPTALITNKQLPVMMVTTVEIKISLHKRQNITESRTTQPSHNVPNRTEFCRREQNYNNRILLKKEPTHDQRWAQISCI